MWSACIFEKRLAHLDLKSTSIRLSLIDSLIDDSTFYWGVNKIAPCLCWGAERSVLLKFIQMFAHAMNLTRKNRYVDLTKVSYCFSNGCVIWGLHFSLSQKTQNPFCESTILRYEFVHMKVFIKAILPSPDPRKDQGLQWGDGKNRVSRSGPECRRLALRMI